jgi:tRNA-2-methylthio-N6-dimethylallyladenosine synthase
MAEYDNICNYLHLPVQSGSDRILKMMNRLYSVEHYMKVMQKAKDLMPGIGLSTDIISCFPSETEEDHKMTIDLIKEVRYDGAYTFIYSPRENTKAYRLPDRLSDEVKKQRMDELIFVQREISTEIHRSLIGKEMEVLIESYSKKSNEKFMGRTDCNKSVILPKDVTFVNESGDLIKMKELNIGDKVKVKIVKANSATLFSEHIVN